MRLIIVDDSVIVREGLRRLLEAEGHQVIEAMPRADRVATAVATGQPDAVILDIRMPPTFTDEGVSLALSLRAATPGLGILVLSQYAVSEYATRLLAGGASGTGYLLKERILAPLQLTEALRRLVGGGVVIDPEVVGDLLVSRTADDSLSRLSERELEVLGLMAEGLTDRGIAGRLFVSPHTVGTHVRRVFQKLDLPSGEADNRRVLAVLTFLAHR